jgi:hypothetical protein
VFFDFLFDFFPFERRISSKKVPIVLFSTVMYFPFCGGKEKLEIFFKKKICNFKKNRYAGC